MTTEAEARGTIVSLRDALQLAIDWHASTPEFVVKYGHGASGREMVAVLREAAMIIDGAYEPCAALGGSPECGPATYCGWDRQWFCERHAGPPSYRHHGHPALTLRIES